MAITLSASVSVSASVSASASPKLKLPFEIKEKYYTEQISNYNLPLVQRIIYSDSLISLCMKSDSITKALEYALNKAAICMEEGEYLSAFENYRIVLERINLELKRNSEQKELKQYELDKQNELHSYALEAMLQLGKCGRNIGLYERSSHYLFDLFKKADIKKDKDYIVKAQSFLGSIFFELGNLQMGNRYQRMAVMEVEQDSSLDLQTKISVYNNFAGMFYQKKDYDSAFYYLLKSHTYVSALQDKRKEAAYLNNLALLYETVGEDDLAKDCFLRAIELTSTKKLNYSKGITLQGLARYYTKQKQYDKAQECYQESIILADRFKMSRLKSKSLEEQANLLYTTAKYTEAYKTLRAAYALKDSVFDEQNTEKIMMYSNLYENNRIKTENEILHQDLIISSLKNDKKSIMLVVFISLIVVITIFTLRIIKKLNKQSRINIKNLQVLDEKDLQFNETLEEQNRKLTSQALVLAQTQEQMQQLKEAVKLCKEYKNIEEKDKTLFEIEKTLGRMGADKSWDEFRLYFEQVNSHFYEKLYQLAPTLTKTEQRICALLALNLTAKEIAAITNRSVRTIETFNYRIRKKLDIPTGEKTSQFFCNLLG